MLRIQSAPRLQSICEEPATAPAACGQNLARILYPHLVHTCMRIFITMCVCRYVFAPTGVGVGLRHAGRALLTCRRQPDLVAERPGGTCDSDLNTVFLVILLYLEIGGPR